MRPDTKLFKRNILVAEDEFFQAFDYRNELIDRGAEVTGPLATVDTALDCVRSDPTIDAAIIDLNLGGEFAYPIADELIKRDIPLLFATAYEPDVLPYRFRHIPRCVKPLKAAEIANVLGALLLSTKPRA